MDGVPVLVDPGSYVYTSDPEARNLFRSTRSTTPLSIDGEEQNEIRPEWLFRMFEKADPEHLEVDRADGDCMRYRGRHHGYTRLPQPVVHERTFTFSRQRRVLTIGDVLRGSGHPSPSTGIFILRRASRSRSPPNGSVDDPIRARRR